MKLRLTKQAQQDLDDAADWYDANSPWLAERFLIEVAETFERVIQNPERFPRIEVAVSNLSRDWRRVVLKRFSYVVVYFIDRDVVVVVAVSHTSRDWTSHLTDEES
jgi:plasmid stabilization system protein ParE